MAEVIICGRWRLRDGKQAADLIDLMQNSIIPHYRIMDPGITWGLLQITDSPSYLTTQRWPSRERWAAFPDSPLYEAWFDTYVPMLEQWDTLVELEDEWECEELLSSMSA